MAIRFRQTSAFVETRKRLEQHLFESVLEIEQDPDRALASIQIFGEAFERLIDTLEQMYQTLRKEDTHGEKSFPIREGRYRVFYKITAFDKDCFEIVFLDIDDNKQSNLDRFPEHKIISFEDDGSS